MRVLVTGHRGYLGSVMVGVLRNSHCEVIGLDCDYYEGCDFGRVRETNPSYDIDLRDIDFADLISFDAVIHLAGLPEDATATEAESSHHRIDEEATVHLATRCKEARVSRFLFASTCRVSSPEAAGQLDDRHSSTPGTPFARTKQRCERALLDMADETFTPVILRNADVYGVSPRMRLDLFVNACVASAVTSGRAVIPGDGSAWRSLIHIEDLARVYATVLAAPDDLVHAQVFHVASPGKTCRMIDIADAVADLVPQCARHLVKKDLDEPSYRIDTSKLTSTFPQLSFRWTLRTGIRQLRNAMENAGLTPGDVRSDRYRRMLRLETLCDRGDIGADLRRAQHALVS